MSGDVLALTPTACGVLLRDTLRTAKNFAWAPSNSAASTGPSNIQLTVQTAENNCTELVTCALDQPLSHSLAIPPNCFLSCANRLLNPARTPSESRLHSHDVVQIRRRLVGGSNVRIAPELSWIICYAGGVAVSYLFLHGLCDISNMRTMLGIGGVTALLSLLGWPMNRVLTNYYRQQPLVFKYLHYVPWAGLALALVLGGPVYGMWRFAKYGWSEMSLYREWKRSQGL
eukprot:TRINITY_DN7730_c0_g1_i1.p1 TRINITY_DN7730_c0_g1~~TRINITY_DN7730_c0_g1_i1.p1  ORF type:complete len:245 (-),score=13.09 TRINITY_DN7730_c0_g1_i1:173-859(-)